MNIKLANAFNPTISKHAFFVECYKKEDSYYYKVSYPIIYDTIADKFLTSVEDLENEITISLDDPNVMYYIHLECKTNQDNFRLDNNPKIRGSPTILPYIDGSDNETGFTQTFCRAMIAIIGYKGKISQNIRYIPDTSLSILNGSPVVRFGKSYSIYY